MAATEQKTQTDVCPTNAPTSTANVPEVPTAATEPKTETDVCPTNAPKSTGNAPEVPVAATEPKTKTDVPPTNTPNSTVSVPEIKTVDVSNVSLGVTEKDIWEFFSFSGGIHYIEMKSESETTQHAFVTFRDSQGAYTAALLTGATIGALPVSVRPVENYQLPPEAPPLTPEGTDASAINSDRKHEVAQKAEDVVSTMLAKGFVLGKDALKKAKSFDEKHQFTSNASATVASIDRKMGLTQKISMGTAVMNEKMKAVDERYQVSEATKSAIAAAEQKATTAGSALMSNRYVSSGAVWVSGALAAFAKAAEGVGSKTKEKVDKAEEEKEGSKTKEKGHEAEENKEPNTKEKVQNAEEENEGSKTKEQVDKEGSKTEEKVQKVEECSNKDSPVIAVKPSNDNNLPNP